MSPIAALCLNAFFVWLVFPFLTHDQVEAMPMGDRP